MNKEKRTEGTRQNAMHEVLAEAKGSLMKAWMEAQLASITLRDDLMTKKDLDKESGMFLDAFINVIGSGNLDDITAPEYKPIVAMLERISLSRSKQGYSASETATFIFSLKDSILKFLQGMYGDQPEVLNREVLVISKLLDKLGLVVVEHYAASREAVISSQALAILEVSTPVLKVWEGIVMMSLIGTVDTKRAQQITENLLQAIVATESEVAILDLAGVPAMDTKVAKHVLDTVQAAEMLGAICIVTGISPAMAQTITKLGIDVSRIESRATMRAGLAHAFRALRLKVVAVDEPLHAPEAGDRER